STATAEFFENGSSIGTTTGAVTSLHDNASRFTVGADEDSGGNMANFFDGKIDDVRVFDTIKTDSFIFQFKDVHIASTTGGLEAYYKFNGDLDDETSGAHHLTHSGSATYSTDVPFSSPSSRLDLDQSLDATG